MATRNPSIRVPGAAVQAPPHTDPHPHPGDAHPEAHGGTRWGTLALSLGAPATFGAFTALYGRRHTHRPRLLMQASAAGYLVAMVTIGTAVALSPQRDWLIIPVVTLAAAGAAS